MEVATLLVMRHQDSSNKLVALGEAKLPPSATAAVFEVVPFLHLLSESLSPSYSLNLTFHPVPSLSFPFCCSLPPPSHVHDFPFASS
mmetsp:Transcript_48494/g.101315  ORF Transcript_48494/g.101315 Transcript_48494/m.101315 type:complete len:87 (-) Transcript_48494:673-933(-)